MIAGVGCGRLAFLGGVWLGVSDGLRVMPRFEDCGLKMMPLVEGCGSIMCTMVDRENTVCVLE